MRFASIITVSLLMLSCGGGSIPTENPAHFPLDQLAGSWEDVNRDNKFYEQWEHLGDNHMLGQGFVLSGSDTVFIEQLEITQKGNDLYYIVNLSGASQSSAVEFRMTEMTNDQVTFENPNHDFPKKISYKLISIGEMEVFLNGMENGTFGEDRFSFVRNEM